ncbi:MAG: zinc/manganese transport system substrate-binding protein [Fimbriimonadaceae bacterium]|jgi:ABC-type Zn uptake system ZnuABC Zn-binding protein ZnuA|nr:zinc/manganese transport system substrate-binding protein [Fimbriimonadaceae bacterium]
MLTQALSILTAAVAIAPGSRLTVVTTTSDLASIAQSVGGSHVVASSLIVGARDPHRLEAKPSYMSRVSKADLFIAVGLDLEVGYENPILTGSHNARVQLGAPGHLYAADGVPVLEKPNGGVSRAMGDIHPFGNPHYWLDPFNARIMANRMADRMSQLQPASARDFRANANAFVRNLDDHMFGSAAVDKYGADKLWDWDSQGVLLAKTGNQVGGWAGKMAQYRGRPVITYHRSWTYFVNRFDLKVVDELEPKPGLDPTPGHIRDVVNVGKQNGVKAILQEPFYSDRASRFVAQRIGANVAVLPASVGQDPGAKDYVSLMDTIVSKVAAALGG